MAHLLSSCLTSLVVLFALSPSIAAPVVSEYEMLRSLPAETFAPLLAAQGEPDANGLVGYHRQQGQWYQAGMQRGGCWYLIGGVVAGDLARVEKAWTSIDATFARQVADGGFLSVKKPYDKELQTFDDRVETTYFYLQELGHAILVLKQSPFEPVFRERIEALKPKTRRAVDFVHSGYDGIVRKVGHTANRLLIAAKAFGLCGVWLDEPRDREAARKLVAVALTLRDADGVFVERGGRDSSYNAVSLLMAQVLALHLPDLPIAEAMQKAMAWQRTRIRPTGEVEIGGNTRTGLGQEKSRGEGIKKVNYREVALALCYYGLVHADPTTIDLAAKVAAWRERGEVSRLP